MSIALVTGSTRGIGFATAQALSRTGASVILTGRDLSAAETSAATLRGDGREAIGIALDVTSAASISAAVELVQQRYGTLDVLINNAGIVPEATATGPSDFADAEIFQKTFATNVFGAVAVTEAFLPLLRRSPMARIVNVSSFMGSLALQEDPTSPYYPAIVPAYQSSKAALNSVTISLAKRLADTDIKVTSVCPGHVQTDLTPSNRTDAPLTADEAATIVVHAAQLPDNASSGTFIGAGGRLPW